LNNDEVYDLPTVVNPLRLFYLIVRDNLIIFYYKSIASSHLFRSQIIWKKAMGWNLYDILY